MKLEIPVALLPVRRFFTKHHAVIFISFITLLLAIAIYTLYMSSTAQPVDNPTSTIGQFDQATIDKIKELHDSSDATSELAFPESRSNPFTE
jgi:cell division protein FtsL